MIYTVTFNPSLDYIIRLDTFTAGTINRTKYEQILGGGKGINVSIVLGNLGIRSTALGFIAGFTGQEIERQLLMVLLENIPEPAARPKRENESLLNGPQLDASKAGVVASQDQVDDLLDSLGF